MPITSFLKTDQFENVSGIYKIKFLPVRKIAAIPKGSGGNVATAISLVGAAAWFDGEFIPTSIDFGDKAGSSAAGKFRNMAIKGIYPKISPSRSENFRLMQEERYFIVLAYELSGYVRIIGTIDAPAEFDFDEINSNVKTGNNYYSIEFNCVDSKPALFYQAAAEPFFIPWSCDANSVLSMGQKRMLLPFRELLSMPTTSTSYAGEDARANLTGFEIDFFTLPCKNFSGITDTQAAVSGITKSYNRFTNTKGGTVYDGSDGSIPNVALDHLQMVWDGTRNCLMFAINITSYSAANIDWSGAMAAAAASSHSGYTDWRLPNMRQLHMLCFNNTSAIALNFAPFSQTSNRKYWSDETVNSSISSAYALDQAHVSGATIKTTTSNYRYVMLRKYVY